MLKAAVAGASGYAGAVLCGLLRRHPEVELSYLLVSERSEDKDKPLSTLYGNLAGAVDDRLTAWRGAEDLPSDTDLIFLCTDHKVSHDVVPGLLKRGVRVFDLSGAFRLHDPQVFERYYGFAHEHPQLLQEAVYALAEFSEPKCLQQARLLALPGCYPTASQLALKPLLQDSLLDTDFMPVINAVSGVSGAGRKAKLTSSFCEVSLNAYGVFTHRHLPEICEHLKQEVIFTPHLGNFKRGILATVTARLKAGVGKGEVKECYQRAYAGRPLVRLKDTMPKVQDVQGTAYCDLGWACDRGHIVICSAIDNLMKGAAAQAVQIMNLCYGFSEGTALL